MKALHTIRYVILAVMIVGSFANFAQNEWGNTVIVASQIALALSFLIQIFLVSSQSYRQLHGKRPAPSNFLEFCKLVGSSLLVVVAGTFSISTSLKKEENTKAHILECVLLFLGFLGAIFRNLFLTGAAIISVLALAELSIFYLIAAIRFVIKTFKTNRVLALLGGGIVVSGVILSLAILFTVQHWPGGAELLNIGLVMASVLLSLTLWRKFNFNKSTITINQGLAMVSSNFVFVFYMCLMFTGYIWAKRIGIAPAFYSQHYPASVYKSAGGRAIEEKDAYESFIKNCRSNGLLK